MEEWLADWEREVGLRYAVLALGREAPTRVNGLPRPIVLLYRPILQGGPPLNEALRVRRIGLCFFFSFELSYLRAPTNPRLAGAPEVGTQLSQEPLAVRTFIVQNGPAWS
jgi:hypothetical protein